MDEQIESIIKQIHDAPQMVALVIAGAGTQALAWLLGVPGATRTVLEAVVPYSAQASINYLAWEPPHFATAATARSLAAASYARALLLRQGDVPVFGVSCEATIVTDRPKRGAHRCHIAIWDGQWVTITSLELVKGLRDRTGEEELVSRLLIHSLAKAYGLDADVPLNLDAAEEIRVSRQPVGGQLDRLFSGEVNTLTFYGPDVFVADEPMHVAILPGSFNPLHSGHIQLARVAEARLREPVMFEMSIHNVDKPSLTREQIERRLTQFVGGSRRLVLTREPLYVGKAALFRGCTFVVGFDTASRLIDPAYYDGDRQQMLDALAAIRDAGCRFLVAGRLHGDVFRTLDDMRIPVGFENLFEGLPEEAFRVDLSSSYLRGHNS